MSTPWPQPSWMQGAPDGLPSTPGSEKPLLADPRPPDTGSPISLMEPFSTLLSLSEVLGCQVPPPPSLPLSCTPADSADPLEKVFLPSGPLPRTAVDMGIPGRPGGHAWFENSPAALLSRDFEVDACLAR